MKMSRTFLEEVRQKWYDIIVELLQCPICFEIPRALIFQCSNGHHVCQDCRKRLINCPSCQAEYGPHTRNFVAEELSTKLDDIKTSLIDPHDPINKNIFRDKICVSTQTSLHTKNVIHMICREKSITSNSTQQQMQDFTVPPRVGKGYYPCLISSCTTSLPHGRIINHLRNYHGSVFFEFNNNRQRTFLLNGSLQYVCGKTCNIAFHVKNMGIFYLKINIDDEGELTANIQIVNCVTESKQFTYRLEIGNVRNSVTYHGTVLSCRRPQELLFPDSLYISSTHMKRMTNSKGDCDYTVIIHRTGSNVNNLENCTNPNIFKNDLNIFTNRLNEQMSTLRLCSFNV